MTVLEIVADVTRRLTKLEVNYVIGGSLASGVWGELRNTNDADIAIMLGTVAPEALWEAFGEPYLISVNEIREALSQHGEFRAVQLMHMDEVFKIDLFLLPENAYAQSEIQRGRSVEVAEGLTLRYAAPENIVIAKLRRFELGNRVSDRQWNDIVQVLEIQKGNLDEGYLHHWAVHFGIEELLREAQAQVRA